MAIAYREQADAAAEVVDAGPCRGPGVGRRSATSADERAVQAFFERGANELGPAESWSTTPAITRDTHIMLMDTGALARVLDVNLRGRVLLRPRSRSRHAAAAVGPDHQRVLAERADAAARADQLRRVESGSRRASRGRCRAISPRKGVLVNAVAPGLIETEMLAEHAGGAGSATSTRCRSSGPALRARWRRWSRFSRPTRRLHHRPGHRRRRRAALDSPDGQTPNMSHLRTN